MFKKNFSIFVILVLFAALSACSKNGTNGTNGSTGPTGPVGPAGPSYTGAINGHVTLYDQYGSKQTTNLTTVQLQLNGGSAIAPTANGYYIFPNVTTGDYYMLASNTGYASTRANTFQFLADTLNKDIKLSAIPNFAPTSVSAYPAIYYPGDSLVINFTPDTRARNCIVFVNNTSTVNNMPANYVLAYTKAINAGQNNIKLVIPAADLYNVGLTTGTTVYCAAYGYVVGDVSVYEDLTTGKNVYNAVSASAVTFNAIVP